MLVVCIAAREEHSWRPAADAVCGELAEGYDGPWAVCVGVQSTPLVANTWAVLLTCLGQQAVATFGEDKVKTLVFVRAGHKADILGVACGRMTHSAMAKRGAVAITPADFASAGGFWYTKSGDDPAFAFRLGEGARGLLDQPYRVCAKRRRGGVADRTGCVCMFTLDPFVDVGSEYEMVFKAGRPCFRHVQSGSTFWIAPGAGSWAPAGLPGVVPKATDADDDSDVGDGDGDDDSDGDEAGKEALVSDAEGVENDDEDSQDENEAEDSQDENESDQDEADQNEAGDGDGASQDEAEDDGPSQAEAEDDGPSQAEAEDDGPSQAEAGDDDGAGLGADEYEVAQDADGIGQDGDEDDHGDDADLDAVCRQDYGMTPAGFDMRRSMHRFAGPGPKKPKSKQKRKHAADLLPDFNSNEKAWDDDSKRGSKHAKNRKRHPEARRAVTAAKRRRGFGALPDAEASASAPALALPAPAPVSAPIPISAPVSAPPRNPPKAASSRPRPGLVGLKTFTDPKSKLMPKRQGAVML